MNCVERFLEQVSRNPDRCAIWIPRGPSISFGELKSAASRLQKHYRDSGLTAGDPVLVFLGLSIELYATAIALLSMGCPLLLIEPWMPASRIEHALQTVQPKGFIAGALGKLWGLRTSGVRRIPHWISPRPAGPAVDLDLESVDRVHPGILTFTSGTTGSPKGAVRTHGYLLDQHSVFERSFHSKEDPGVPSSDWSIFANFTFANLASGRTTILMPPAWELSDFSAVCSLPDDLAPRSLTCGPAFLKKMLTSKLKFQSLSSIHVGGALTDCSLFEEAFLKFPQAQFLHVYGSTEAEPVALMDARVATQESRKAGFMQTLCLGKPVPEIQFEQNASSLWVSGAHVCPKYLGNDQENRLSKRIDLLGNTWHNMGDRIQISSSGYFWFHGRSQQPVNQFLLEQDLYRTLGHTSAFLHQDKQGSLWLLGEQVSHADRQIRKKYPSINYIEDLSIVRDQRHRSRIDRKTTLQKGAPWLTG